MVLIGLKRPLVVSFQAFWKTFGMESDLDREEGWRVQALYIFFSMVETVLSSWSQSMIPDSSWKPRSLLYLNGLCLPYSVLNGVFSSEDKEAQK